MQDLNRAIKRSLLAALLVAPVFASAQTVPTLTVQVDKPLHALPPTFYGLMTEEINYSYDGGLYAEMVRNRAFRDHGFGGVARWNLDNQGNARATMTIDENVGPSAALQSSLRVDVIQADPNNMAGLRNDGYWGMAALPQTTYQGSLYARADAASFGPLHLSLVNDVTGEALASATIDAVGTDWKQYNYTLKTGKIQPSKNNHLLITAAHTGKLWLDLVSLFPPTYKNRENGNRADLMNLLAGMHPTFLRMPGGNYLEGDLIDERFDWKTTIGPLVDRPTHRSPWNYTSTDGLGLLEFLNWTEDLKIQPVLAVFAGYALKGDHIRPGPALTPYVDDVLDELEFVTGDTSTKWGALRAKYGHPAPFPLQYVEIGNEDNFDRSGSYEGRYMQFYKAIKAKYPQLQLIATMPLKNFKPDVLDDHYYKRADEFMDFVHHYDKQDRNGPKIFIGEWATREGAPTTNMGAALGDAAWMTAMERNSDLILMAAYAPLLVNVNPGGMQWESNLIGYDAGKAYASPSYYAQAMFAEYLGKELLPTTITDEPTRFFSSATRDSEKGKLYLKLVNASSQPQPIDLKLQGAGRIAQNATLVTLKGTNPADTNTIDDPRQLVPVTSKVSVKSDFRYTVPPYSVQILAIDAKP